jgi:hypothetical protein
MVASRASAYPNSAQFYVKNGDAEGFADVRACVTTDGYGFSGRGAQACEVGTYNGKDNWDSCKPCPWGYTTAGVGRGVSLASCGVAAGFGYSVQQQSVVPCPIGESFQPHPESQVTQLPETPSAPRWFIKLMANEASMIDRDQQQME